MRVFGGVRGVSGRKRGCGGAGRGEKGRGGRRRKEEKEKGSFCRYFVKLVYIFSISIYFD